MEINWYAGWKLYLFKRFYVSLLDSEQNYERIEFYYEMWFFFFKFCQISSC